MSEPYWLLEPSPLPSALGSCARVDVAIVGGGVTGCATALRLAERGLRVRLHEAREIASGASGRNGGFVLRGGALRYDHARREYGHAQARRLWRWTESGVDRVEQLGGNSFRRCGAARVAVDPGELEQVRDEYDALREDGFGAEWEADGFVSPRDGAYHPARFVRRLAAAAAAAGAELHEHARVASLEELDADHVVVATDGYGRGLVPALDRAIRPVRNQVLVTEPLAERSYPRPHYGRHGHAYWQQLDDGRLLIGGFRDAAFADEETDEEAVTPTVQDALERFLDTLVQPRPRIERRWSGIFGATQDLLPLAGRLPGDERMWVAAGYSGHGNVLGLLCGELVADAILGRCDEQLLALLDPARLVVSESG